MMKTFFPLSILLCALFLCGCGEEKKTAPAIDYRFEDEPVSTDTISPDTLKNVGDSLGKENAALKKEEKTSRTFGKSTSAPRGRTPSSRHSKSKENRTEDDGMRGFDPISENDMHDNGVSRFMENDDSEGWD